MSHTDPTTRKLSNGQLVFARDLFQKSWLAALIVKTPFKQICWSLFLINTTFYMLVICRMEIISLELMASIADLNQFLCFAVAFLTFFIIMHEIKQEANGNVVICPPLKYFRPGNVNREVLKENFIYLLVARKAQHLLPRITSILLFFLISWIGEPFLYSNGSPQMTIYCSFATSCIVLFFTPPIWKASFLVERLDSNSLPPEHGQNV